MNKADRIWKEIDEPFLLKSDFEKVLPIIEKELLPKPCVWKHDFPRAPEFTYKSGCGVQFYDDNFSIQYLKIKFCPYCGGKIIETPKGE